MADALTPATLRERFDRIRHTIGEAARRSGREGSEITIVAVTKGWPTEVVAMAIDVGITDIGENRVQEALSKREALRPGVRFHLVGHLQRNKASRAADLFDVIHSISSVEVAEALSRAAARRDRVIEVLLQVNVAADPAKHGVSPEESASVLERVVPLPCLRVTGLMTIGPLTQSPEESRPYFSALRELRDRLASRWSGLHHLSMGMSADYPVAIEEGATMVRIGTALFGERTP